MLIKAVFIMEMIGISSIVPMGYRSRAKGVEELIKTSSVRKGIDAAKRRLALGAGSGILKAAATRMGMGMARGPWPVGGGCVSVARLDLLLDAQTA